MLPVEALTAALSQADAWVEFNKQWLLYSTPFERAMAQNKRLRYMCLVEMTVDMMVRLIGRIDAPLLIEFMHKVTDMTQKASHMRITTPAGNDLSFRLLQQGAHWSPATMGCASTPGMHFLGGQISFFPEFETINGKMVFDGTISPPCGFLKEPVVLEIEKGISHRYHAAAVRPESCAPGWTASTTPICSAWRTAATASTPAPGCAATCWRTSASGAAPNGAWATSARWMPPRTASRPNRTWTASA